MKPFQIRNPAFILTIFMLCALSGCTKQYESSGLVQISLKGANTIDVVRTIISNTSPGQTLTISELKNTDLLKISIIDKDAQKAADIVNDVISSAQKAFKNEHPEGTFIIWEKAEPASIGNYR